MSVALAFGASACAVEPYACQDHVQCVRGGASGRCEEPGYCAYTDEACPGGLRFSPNAGDGLASACVGDSAGSDSDGSSGAAPSTGMSEGSGPGGEPSCGDGRLDPGETCDDGNHADGDGCSATCVVSGTERWVRRHAGAGGGDDRGLALVVLASGAVVVAAEQGERDGTHSALALRWGPDGGEEAPPWLDALDDDRRVYGLGSDGTSVLMAGEQPSSDPAGSRAWFARLSIELEPLALGAVDTLADEAGRGVAVAPTLGYVLVGEQGGVAWARWLDDDRPDWHGEAVTSIDAVAQRSDGAFAVVGTTAAASVRWWLVSSQGAVLGGGQADGDRAHAAAFDPNGRLLLAGLRGGQAWLAAHELDGAMRWAAAPTATAVHGLAVSPAGDALVAGRLDDRGWVGRWGDDGSERWSGPVLSTNAPTELHAIAWSENGLIVTGTERSPAGDLDVVVASLEP